MPLTRLPRMTLFCLIRSVIRREYPPPAGKAWRGNCFGPPRGLCEIRAVSIVKLAQPFRVNTVDEVAGM
eukprot:13169484-Alexandrium_andersonii.AAC.1